MINNIEAFKRFMNFRNDDEFYFLQVYKRKKDNPSLKGDNKTMGDYHIYSIEELDKVIPHVIKLCDDTNSRAYMRPNKRSASTVAVNAIAITSHLILGGQQRQAYKAYNKACGNSHVNYEKFWIVDIDDKDPLLLESVKASIIRLYSLAKVEREIALELPTLNGYHLIAPPFNRKEFNNQFPEVSIHLDNPTVLYYNPV